MREQFGGLQRAAARALFTFACRGFTEEERIRKKLQRLIPRRTGVVGEHMEAFGKVVSATQTVRLPAMWYGRLIPSCIYEFTTGVSVWAHAVTENCERGGRQKEESGVHGHEVVPRSEATLPFAASFPKELYFGNLLSLSPCCPYVSLPLCVCPWGLSSLQVSGVERGGLVAQVLQNLEVA